MASDRTRKATADAKRYVREKASPDGYERIRELRRRADSKRGSSHTRTTPEKRKDKKLREAFGITLEQYNEMLEAQNGNCAICDREHWAERTGFLCVDHDRRTGSIRGLLCTRCNVGIGMLGDSPARLMNTVLYLEG